jgi:hypothetical protein
MITIKAIETSLIIIIEIDHIIAVEAESLIAIKTIINDVKTRHARSIAKRPISYISI